MATGIPKKNSTTEDLSISLSYAGKRTPEEILSTPPSRTVPIGSNYASYRNRLYFGDNLGILSHLLSDSSICGKVTLIYIDPPFSTQSLFMSRKLKHAYDDTLEGAQYVEFLRQRLYLLKELMAPEGSIYLHLDEKMVFHMKLVMDEVFGTDNYRNCIVRKKCNPKNYTRKTYGNIADFILFYAKSDKYVWNRPLESWTEERAKEYQYIEPETGRRFMKVPLHAPGVRNGETGKPWRGMLPPPGKHWQYPPSKLDEMDARGEIYWSANGNPRRKVYLDESPGVGVQDIWLDFKDAHNQNIKITGYPTEKNPDLLKRIIEASSNPGDLVLDCFSGSGTTLAVAAELQRHWIGVDKSVEAIKTTLERFERGTHPMGDFVKKAKKKENDHQPSLFDSLEVEKVSPQASKHKPIVDFSILAEQTLFPEIARYVADWDARVSSQVKTSRATPLCVTESSEYADICSYLRNRDKKLAKVIQEVGSCTLSPKDSGFVYLMDAIIGQQLSMTAATTIRNKVREAFGKQSITARLFLRLAKEAVLDAGVSKRKYNYLRDLAERVTNKQLDLMRLPNMPDKEIMRTLTSVKGIGAWTIEMYLLFALNRPDVFPSHDLALRKVMSKVYDVDPADDQMILSICEKWRPYRSVASWYLYKFSGIVK